MPKFVTCAGCMTPLRDGNPAARLTRGIIEAGELEVDDTAEVVYLCFACAENVDNIHGQMRLSGRE